ncbi:SDR family oxidoreductase [Tunicatimonas pelagia]|uniref:SDR family oxidoreductase n=1 Tax=Tunicatimonas pelagia TaxID=931531 RepID=UPI0026661C68|nr:SDR family oxidoreductase [Tunicatimonas pelagia]WKN41392.1 SDR family NAD(P)-dependent oxidoreductase [Tunicatimonas pelagia]
MKKLVVISGAGKGIGKALAQRFAAEGFSLALCARTEADLQALQTKLTQKHPGIEVFIRPTDVSKKEAVLDFAQMVQATNIPVEVLVNNAGVFLPGQIYQEEDGALEKQIETNLYSAYHLTRALVPAMIEAKRGHIFNICSTASITAYTNGGSYCISKFALLGMSKVLREEMKPHHIRVTSVLPGATLTNSWAGSDLPEERFMPPEDIAEAVFSTYQLSDRTVIEEILMRPQLGDIT